MGLLKSQIIFGDTVATGATDLKQRRCCAVRYEKVELLL